MLAVLKEHRSKGIGKTLVKKICEKINSIGVDLVILETECCNKGALRLYEGKIFFHG